ncbi:carbohydrate-binding protein [Methylomarinum sp. Ch1-1]|uniref:Carbohydrate-binding protein n=1 Tax=Methylomarinum roseum TaxID=3067653 RepID=A0AAU7NQL8_9GAMM|nr:carbohydrate-binding protein [Methylomarinum sp. Ch1-1]MDP4520814.1 carbohydrate-binding protein [Methylomarinum sp. Ch1-1]
MRKRIITPEQRETSIEEPHWLNLEELAKVELSSEDVQHPIENALLPGAASGWLAAVPGEQTIRLIFIEPQRLRRIRLSFVETEIERTQEYVLRWSSDHGESFQEIVRQQWHFSPQGSTHQIEDHVVELAEVSVLELNIKPDISGGRALASLALLRLA